MAPDSDFRKMHLTTLEGLYRTDGPLTKSAFSAVIGTGEDDSLCVPWLPSALTRRWTDQVRRREREEI